MNFKRNFLVLFSVLVFFSVLPAVAELKQKPQSAEECKEDVRVDVTTIINDSSGKLSTKLIPEEDRDDIKEHYKQYQEQKKNGDITISAEEELKRNMVELYCTDISGSSSNADTDKNDNTDELKKQFKQEADNVVAAFQTQTKKIKEKQQNSENKKG